MMLTPFEISEAIEAETDHLEQLMDELRVATQRQAIAEVNLKVNFAQTRLNTRSNGTDDYGRLTADVVDDIAMVNTRDERHENLLATSAVMTCREAIRTCQTRIEALRTLSASTRNAP